MLVQIVFVLAAFVCCNCQSTAAPDLIRQRIEQRVAQAETLVKNEIKKLLDENRDYLAIALQQEEQRLEVLGNELKNTNPGPEALRLLEEEIIGVVTRIEREADALTQESKTQDELLAAARVLKQNVTDEITKLEAVEGRDRARAQQTIANLQREEAQIQLLVDQLTQEQNPFRVGAIEVELRTIENRVRDELRRLGDVQPPPVTARPSTARPSTARGSTARGSTARPSTARPSRVGVY